MLARIVLAVLALSAGCRTGTPGAQLITLSPATMSRVGTVNERYQSYNIEMLEVTGGKFWKPYGPSVADVLMKPPAPTPGRGDVPAGMDPGLYEYRPPIDLTNARLRTLAAALAPAYVRVSGTWANNTYFAETDPPPPAPPPGFNGVLTSKQWRGVVDFANAVDAQIVTSFAISMGTRDKTGVWSPEQARRFVAYTRSLGGRIAAAEFMNEPNLAAMGGAPPDYDPAAYGRDFKLFRAFAEAAAPDMLILGPGSVGESTGDWALSYGGAPVLRTRDLLVASGLGVDAFSYHHYGAVSRRCAAMGNQTTADQALSEQWLRRTDETLAFYRRLRDELEPGAPFWLTETADAACGGNPWGRTFLDSFRYLDQLGRLALQEVKVVAHNTLVASDYGLLDDRTLMPKPNYWAALLWRRLMGATVLDSAVTIRGGLHLYAHCLRDTPGGVALLALNTATAAHTLSVPLYAEIYTLSADTLNSGEVRLNGRVLALGRNDDLPIVAGVSTPVGRVTLAPRTITFIALPGAANSACREPRRG